MSNLQKLDALLESKQKDLDEVYELLNEAEKRKKEIFKAIGDLSEKFDPEDTVDQDELEERFGEIAESFDMVWNGHWNGYDYYKVGNRVVFWVPSNC